MKEHFERQIAHRKYTFNRVNFPSGAWYRVHTVVQDAPIQFWMKRGSSGLWKIQPQLLDTEILAQEGALSLATLQQEVKAPYYS